MFKKIFYTYIFAQMLFFLNCNFCFASPNSFPYMSPGLRIGWEFGRGLTISFKVSFGINTDEDFNCSKYYNITFGLKVPLQIKNSHSYEKYNFIQFQAGSMVPGSGLFWGGGLGVMYYKDHNSWNARPMGTVDFGCLIFLSYDFIFLQKKKIVTDFGILGILPIPLRKLDSGFN